MLHIAGAGGFGRETLDVVLALRRDVAAFLDDRRAGETIRGLPVLSPDDAPAGHDYVVAIADHGARRRLAALLDGRGLHPTTLVHPRAAVGPETKVGPGCIILAGVYISSNVTLAGHVQVSYNATVGHDSILEEFSTIFPGGNVAGAVRLGTGATVGANSVVLQGLSVGAGAFIGAGAVVTHDVEHRAVVVGVPARPLRG